LPGFGYIAILHPVLLQNGFSMEFSKNKLFSFNQCQIFKGKRRFRHGDQNVIVDACRNEAAQTLQIGNQSTVAYARGSSAPVDAVSTHFIDESFFVNILATK